MRLPLSRRGNPDAQAEYELLVETIEPYMAPGLTRYVNESLYASNDWSSDARVLMEVGEMMHYPLDFSGGVITAILQIEGMIQESNPLVWDVIDELLHITGHRSGMWPAELANTLQRSRSVWAVGVDAEGDYCLQRRLDESTVEAATAAMSPNDNASKHLRTAWDTTYGRSNDFDKAYAEAIKAVEAILRPLVSPTDASATLGKMRSALRDKGEKWIFSLGRVSTVEALVSDLWDGQKGRHGTDDTTVVLSVDRGQAQAALTAAVSLVTWCRSEAFRIA